MGAQKILILFLSFANTGFSTQRFILLEKKFSDKLKFKRQLSL